MFLGSMRRLLAHCTPFLLLTSGTMTDCQFLLASGTGELRLRGTIRFVAVENGCWQFEAADGGRYELRRGQAPESILHDGLGTTLVLQPRADLASVCQVGTIADVESVEEIQNP